MERPAQVLSSDRSLLLILDPSGIKDTVPAATQPAPLPEPLVLSWTSTVPVALPLRSGVYHTQDSPSSSTWTFSFCSPLHLGSPLSYCFLCLQSFYFSPKVLTTRPFMSLCLGLVFRLAKRAIWLIRSLPSGWNAHTRPFHKGLTSPQKAALDSRADRHSVNLYPWQPVS